MPYRSEYHKQLEHKKMLERIAFRKRVRDAEPRSTEKQCAFINRIIRKKGWDDNHAIEELRAIVAVYECRETVTHPEHLTKAEASRFIGKWFPND